MLFLLLLVFSSVGHPPNAPKATSYMSCLFLLSPSSSLSKLFVVVALVVVVVVVVVVADRFVTSVLLQPTAAATRATSID